MKKGSNGKIKCRFKRRRGGGLRGWLWGSLECRLRSPSYLILQFLKNNSVMDYDKFDRASQPAPPPPLLFFVREAQSSLDRWRVTSRPAPLPPLLFASSGRRKGHLFNLAWPAPLQPLLFALSRQREGDSFDPLVRVVRAARRSLVRSRVVAHHPAAALVRVVRAARKSLV